MEDDERSGRPRNVVNEENAEIVREFIRKETKSSLKYMESYFDRKFGVHEGLCQICSAHFKTTRKKPQNYLTKNRIVTIHHSLYSPDMGPCDIHLFGKLHMPMKGKRYADVDAIQKASTAILNAIPNDDLKNSFDNLLDRHCIQCEGDYFDGDQ